MFKTPFIVTEPRFGRSNYVGGSNAVAARLNFRGLMARIPMTRAFEPTRPLGCGLFIAVLGGWPGGELACRLGVGVHQTEDSSETPERSISRLSADLCIQGVRIGVEIL